ncbi:DUF4254 domain-containing protein [Nocardia colli]|uniref:DUF4254 domain-containing protein n=1 Tax=Nocardia colli TaxID=2545717 RepID=UPI001CC5A379|nr:DUF4254 domain-containing protein [Nocardia colli]
MLTDPFPPKHQLLQACRGELPADHPLLRLARELTDLHEQRLCAAKDTIADRRHIDDIDSRRAGLVRDIDRWVILQLPPSHGAAHVHTETVGAVVDKLAQYTACAFAALTSASQWELGDAWEQLAELAIGYDDLAAELSAGRRRLPGGP